MDELFQCRPWVAIPGPPSPPTPIRHQSSILPNKSGDRAEGGGAVSIPRISLSRTTLRSKRAEPTNPSHPSQPSHICTKPSTYMNTEAARVDASSEIIEQHLVISPRRRFGKDPAAPLPRRIRSFNLLVEIGAVGSALTSILDVSEIKSRSRQPPTRARMPTAPERPPPSPLLVPWLDSALTTQKHPLQQVVSYAQESPSSHELYV